jgi:hypothetical protein
MRRKRYAVFRRPSPERVNGFSDGVFAVLMRGGEWADAALVSSIECVGLAKSCPGGEFPVGAKFEVKWPLQGPASTVYDVGVDDIRLLQRRRKRK